MLDLPIGALFLILVGLLMVSAFFSSSETAMMALDRYQLKDAAARGHRGAKLTERLLKKIDRLIGLILLGNNFANIAASALVTLIALRLGNEEVLLPVFTAMLTCVVLIFAEVAPKTVAANHPAKIAYPAAYVLTILQKTLSPLVFVVNLCANAFLRLLGEKPPSAASQTMSSAQLRLALKDSAHIPENQQKMLLHLLELDRLTAEDIMTPSQELVGIDLNDSLEDIELVLKNLPFTRAPLYEGHVQSLVGVLHARDVVRLLSEGSLNKKALLDIAAPAYFIPAQVRLSKQIAEFRRSQKSYAFVIDEYGTLKGLLTMSDVLEEVVGNFTSNLSDNSVDIEPREDGYHWVDGTASLHTVGQYFDCSIDAAGASTVNGWLLAHVGEVPGVGTCFKKDGFLIEIEGVQGSAITEVRMKKLPEPVDTDG